METKQAKTTAAEQSEQGGGVWRLEEVVEASSGGRGNYKSYTCSFCKKGFSNAQALGGHMNIHRKDRAKLLTDRDRDRDILQSSQEETNTILSSDNINIHHHVSDQIIVLESSTTEDKGSRKTTNTPCGEDHTSSSDHNSIDQGSSSKQIELDLELRLGRTRASSKSNR